MRVAVVLASKLCAGSILRSVHIVYSDSCIASDSANVLSFGFFVVCFCLGAGQFAGPYDVYGRVLFSVFVLVPVKDPAIESIWSLGLSGMNTCTVADTDRLTSFRWLFDGLKSRASSLRARSATRRHCQTHTRAHGHSGL